MVIQRTLHPASPLGQVDQPQRGVSRDAVLSWLQAYAAAVALNKELLTALDAAIGDADHGITMDRGWQAVLNRLPALADKDIGTILKVTGMTLVATVGGASGPLYGTLFLQMGASAASKLELTLTDWTRALEEGVSGVVRRGKAAPGDKTMVDTLLPAIDALASAAVANAGLAEALRWSQQAAQHGMLATIPLQARKGRASYLGERSAGHQDPGATSSYLLLKTAADTWSGG